MTREVLQTKHRESRMEDYTKELWTLYKEHNKKL
jgi:hypothetical protein